MSEGPGISDYVRVPGNYVSSLLTSRDSPSAMGSPLSGAGDGLNDGNAIISLQRRRRRRRRCNSSSSMVIVVES